MIREVIPSIDCGGTRSSSEEGTAMETRARYPLRKRLPEIDTRGWNHPHELKLFATVGIQTENLLPQPMKLPKNDLFSRKPKGFTLNLHKRRKNPHFSSNGYYGDPFSTPASTMFTKGIKIGLN